MAKLTDEHKNMREEMAQHIETLPEELQNRMRIEVETEFEDATKVAWSTCKKTAEGLDGFAREGVVALPEESLRKLMEPIIKTTDGWHHGPAA